MRKIIKSAIVGVAALTALATVGSTTSYAQGSDGPVLCLPGPSSCVWWKAYGNIIYVKDDYKDGYSAVAQVCAPESCSIRADYVWNTSGGTDHLVYTSLIPEGTIVYYRPCRGTLSTHTIESCSSGWTHGSA